MSAPAQHAPPGRRLDCVACGGGLWLVAEDGRTIGKCPECAPPTTGIERALKSPDAESVRRAVVDRASAPGEWTVEAVLARAFGDEVSFGNVVGAITAVLSREGLIRKVGYRPARRASRAGGAVAIWIGRGDPRFHDLAGAGS